MVIRVRTLLNQENLIGVCENLIESMDEFLAIQSELAFLSTRLENLDVQETKDGPTNPFSFLGF